MVPLCCLPSLSVRINLPVEPPCDALQDPQRMQGSLYALRILTRKYEFRDEEERQPLALIVSTVFPVSASCTCAMPGTALHMSKHVQTQERAVAPATAVLMPLGVGLSQRMQAYGALSAHASIWGSLSACKHMGLSQRMQKHMGLELLVVLRMLMSICCIACSGLRDTSLG